MRVLLAEDDARTASYLHKGLTEQGFVVDIARDGESAARMATQSKYDVMVLDVMLPGCDGWSVLRQLRDRLIDLRVLFLTARDSLEDRVKGLELGADDYLVKPFAFSELIARMRSILRRAQSRQPEQLDVAELQIDPVRHRATRAGVRVNLTPKEFQLLSLLARRNGEVLTRTLIAEQVWDMNFDSDTNVVDVHVRRLRAKIDEGFEHRLIHTVRGVGYVLEDRR